jgi:hypothetical protein
MTAQATTQTPAARLAQHIADGTLIRHEWTGRDAQGRNTAAILALIEAACERAEGAK